MTASIPAGKKKHRVRLVRELDQMDGGRTLPTPVEMAKFWAWIQPLSSQEIGTLRQVMPEVTTRVRTDWRTDVNQATDVLYHNERRLAIASLINVDEDNTVLDILCVEQAGGG